jgi:hypothetical protein
LLLFECSCDKKAKQQTAHKIVGDCNIKVTHKFFFSFPFPVSNRVPVGSSHEKNHHQPPQSTVESRNPSCKSSTHTQDNPQESAHRLDRGASQHTKTIVVDEKVKGGEMPIADAALAQLTTFLCHPPNDHGRPGRELVMLGESEPTPLLVIDLI